MNQKLRIILVCTAAVLLMIPAVLIDTMFLRKMDWQTSLATSERMGTVYQGGEVANMNDASNYAFFAVLAEPQATCHYYMNGKEYALPNPARTKSSNKQSRLFNVRPGTEDLKNLHIDGKTWSWKTTVEKDRSTVNTVSCTGDFFVTERPGLAWHRVLAIAAFYPVYIIVVIFCIYGVSKKFGSKPKV